MWCEVATKWRLFHRLAAGDDDDDTFAYIITLSLSFARAFYDVNPLLFHFRKKRSALLLLLLLLRDIIIKHDLNKLLK